MKFFLALIFSLALGNAAQAGIEWSWANTGTGTEQGTFITSGELVGGEAHAGSYTIVDATVTASTFNTQLGSFSDGTYTTWQPNLGFDWDGTDVTVFWRSSGGLTNGLGLFATEPVSGEPDYITFNIGGFAVKNYGEGITFLNEEITPSLAVIGSITPLDTTALGAIKSLYR